MGIYTFGVRSLWVYTLFVLVSGLSGYIHFWCQVSVGIYTFCFGVRSLWVYTLLVSGLCGYIHVLVSGL